MSGCPDVRMSGCPGVRVSGCPGVRRVEVSGRHLGWWEGATRSHLFWRHRMGGRGCCTSPRAEPAFPELCTKLLGGPGIRRRVSPKKCDRGCALPPPRVPTQRPVRPGESCDVPGGVQGSGVGCHQKNAIGDSHSHHPPSAGPTRPHRSCVRKSPKIEVSQFPGTLRLDSENPLNGVENGIGLRCYPWRWTLNHRPLPPADRPPWRPSRRASSRHRIAEPHPRRRRRASEPPSVRQKVAGQTLVARNTGACCG